VATPIGEAGLAVIRVSGSDTLTIVERCFRPAAKTAPKPSAAPSHTIHFGHVVRDGHTIDEVLIAIMRAPRTFTREDIVEITCHGGILTAKLVLDAILQSGARLAEPGEFTRRAFLNGRIDLAQAEAVADVIQSRTELALRAANEQLAGKLSRRINTLREEMLSTLAHVEAHIDFPDEDIAPDTKEQLISRLEHGVVFIDELLRTAGEGQILRRGVRAAIVGRPNAGKSSLLNQLLGRDRAIVSPIPGTTRDTIEETANLRGLLVVFIDTAGLREARDEIEVEGIRRSRETLENAELILHVIDVTEPLTVYDQEFISRFAEKKMIRVRNKIDLLDADATLLAADDGPESGSGSRSSGRPGLAVERQCTVDVSCITGQGIEPLKDAIKEVIWSGGIDAEMIQVAINSRHEDALNRARAATVRTLEALREGQTLELVAMDLRIAVNAIGEIVGKTATEDLLDVIFSQFCIGK
jgi:tRNA modification GTPase